MLHASLSTAFLLVYCAGNFTLEPRPGPRRCFGREVRDFQFANFLRTPPEIFREKLLLIFFYSKNIQKHLFNFHNKTYLKYGVLLVILGLKFKLNKICKAHLFLF